MICQIKNVFTVCREACDLIEISEFIECCEGGGFIDYDGHGYPSNGILETKNSMCPSEVLDGQIPFGTTHMNWFNR